MEEKFKYKDTILKVKSDLDLVNEVEQVLITAYQELGEYITSNPNFRSSLEHLELDENAPKIVRDMLEAGELFNVGPMATVAGKFSEIIVDECIKKGANWAIVENGGDICLYGDKKFLISMHAGKSPLSDKFGLDINPGKRKYGICTSSSSVGHSISLGDADAVTVLGPSSAITDAAATAVANEVKGDVDENAIDRGIEFSKKFIKQGCIDGVLIMKGENIGKIGKIPRIVELK